MRVNDGTTLDVTRSVFVENVATVWRGGVFFIQYWTRTVNILNCTFRWNGAPNDHGGAVRIEWGWGGSSSFYANGIILQGRADWNFRDSIHGTFISAGTLDFISILNSRFTDCRSGHGGIIAIWTWTGAHPTPYVIDSCTFHGNHFWSVGGAVYMYSHHNRDLNISNCRFSWTLGVERRCCGHRQS